MGGGQGWFEIVGEQDIVVVGKEEIIAVWKEVVDRVCLFFCRGEWGVEWLLCVCGFCAWVVLFVGKGIVGSGGRSEKRLRGGAELSDRRGGFA